jgi:hypothetical protein
MTIKGLTFGSPEYVRISKQAEACYDADKIIDRISESVEELIGHSGYRMDNREQARELRHVRNDLTEIVGDYGEELF